MKPHRFDIVVVGAGPAGSSAALAAAGRGLRVTMIERRDVVGRPVRCAEYIPKPLLGEVNLENGFVVQPVRGMRTFIPGTEVKETLSPGFIIMRDLFDQGLARKAAGAGAEILLSTRVLSRNGNSILLKERGGPCSKIEASVIIGADGPHSTVGAWIGSVNQNLIPAIQVRVPLARPMEWTEVYFDKEIYAGYGWLFPKGGEANVGLGIKPGHSNSGRIRKLLERFVDQRAREGKIRKEILGWMAGWIPAEPPRKVTRENILLAGDAAGQTHPITGAGVAQAVICGGMAGKWAAEAVEKGDLKLLNQYDDEWRDLFGDTLKRAFQRRLLMEREWGSLEHIIKYCWVAFREYYMGD